MVAIATVSSPVHSVFPVFETAVNEKKQLPAGRPCFSKRPMVLYGSGPCEVATLIENVSGELCGGRGTPRTGSTPSQYNETSTVSICSLGPDGGWASVTVMSTLPMPSAP